MPEPSECQSRRFSRATMRGATPYSTIIANNMLKAESARELIAAGRAQGISFGRAFIANPDLVERMQHHWPLAQVQRDTLYGLHGAHGYTDYPRYAEQASSHRTTEALEPSC